MTADRVKYICDHMVTGRVKVHYILLHPETKKTRDTYLKVDLKVEGTLLTNKNRKLCDSGRSTVTVICNQSKWTATSIPSQVAQVSDWWKEEMKENKIPSTIDFHSLSHQLQKDEHELHTSMAMEFQPQNWSCESFQPQSQRRSCKKILANSQLNRTLFRG